MNRPSFHETFDRKEEAPRSSSRGFGFVFAVFFALIGTWPWLFGGGVRWWAIIVAAAFLCAAVAAPALLAPANRVWAAFGLLLHRITNPVVMGILFFLVITPIGLLRRVFVRDPLGLRPRPAGDSYWHERDQRSVASMERQF